MVTMRYKNTGKEAWGGKYWQNKSHLYNVTEFVTELDETFALFQYEDKFDVWSDMHAKT